MILFAIYTLAGFLSSEFWLYVFKTKWFKDDPTARLVYSFGSGILWAAVFTIF